MFTNYESLHLLIIWRSSDKADVGCRRECWVLSLLLGLLFKHTLNPLDDVWGLIHNVKIPINIQRVLLWANRDPITLYIMIQGLQFNPTFHVSCNTLWQVWTMREAQSPGGCNTNTPHSAYLSPHTWCVSPHSSVNWGEPLVTGNWPIKAAGTLHLPCN